MNFTFGILVCILFNTILMCRGDTGFAFQESGEEDKAKQNIFNKQPVFKPGRCRHGELFYPGDQQDDWVCDCKPGFIYHPETDLCYNAYTRGPCTPYQFLILPKNNIIPKCVPNICQREGHVFFRGACHELNKSGPCPLPLLGTYVGVNSTTLELACIQDVILGDRINTFEEPAPDDSEIERFNSPECFIGSKRSYQGICALPHNNAVTG